MFERVLKFLEENKTVTLLLVFLVVYYLMNRKVKKMEGMAVVTAETTLVENKPLNVDEYVGMDKKITFKTIIDGQIYYLSGIPSKFCGVENSQCGNSLVLLDEKSNTFVNKKYKLDDKRRRLYCNVDEYLKSEAESGLEKLSVTVPESNNCKSNTLNCNEFKIRESKPDKFTKEYKLITSPGSLDSPSVILNTVNYVDNTINNKRDLCIDSSISSDYKNQLFIIPTNGKNKVRIGFKIIKDNKQEYLYFCSNKNNTCKIPIGGSKSLSIELGPELIDDKANPEVLDFELIRN